MTDYNYIEEMMKTAEVKPKYYYDIILQSTIKPEEKIYSESCTKTEMISYCRGQKYYNFCKVNKVVKVYPEFTADKQLEIIKLMGKVNSCDRSYFSCGYDYDTKEYSCSKDKFNKDGRFTESEDYYNQDFTQALAQLTTELMNAGELDKEKVKEILNEHTINK